MIAAGLSSSSRGDGTKDQPIEVDFDSDDEEDDIPPPLPRRQPLPMLRPSLTPTKSSSSRPQSRPASAVPSKPVLSFSSIQVPVMKAYCGGRLFSASSREFEEGRLYLELESPEVIVLKLEGLQDTDPSHISIQLKSLASVIYSRPDQEKSRRNDEDSTKSIPMVVALVTSPESTAEGSNSGRVVAYPPDLISSHDCFVPGDGFRGAILFKFDSSHPSWNNAVAYIQLLQLLEEQVPEDKREVTRSPQVLYNTHVSKFKLFAAPHPALPPQSLTFKPRRTIPLKAVYFGANLFESDHEDGCEGMYLELGKSSLHIKWFSPDRMFASRGVSIVLEKAVDSVKYWRLDHDSHDKEDLNLVMEFTTKKGTKVGSTTSAPIAHHALEGPALLDDRERFRPGGTVRGTILLKFATSHRLWGDGQVYTKHLFKSIQRPSVQRIPLSDPREAADLWQKHIRALASSSIAQNTSLSPTKNVGDPESLTPPKGDPDSQDEHSGTPQRAFCPRPLLENSSTVQDPSSSLPPAKKVCNFALEGLSSMWSKEAAAHGAARIEFVNELDNDLPFEDSSKFRYLERHYIQAPRLNLLEYSWLKCQCVNGCLQSKKCACQEDHPPYEDDGTVRSAYASIQGVIIECNENCKCPLTCRYRPSQRPRAHPITIYKSPNKGWCARSSSIIPAGTLVGVYTGNLIETSQAQELPEDDQIYIFDIKLEDKYITDRDEYRPMSVNAADSGNWTRFISHSCEPNLETIHIRSDRLSRVQPYIAFYAIQDIHSNEELTFDYNNDDPENPVIKACQCGSANCRSPATPTSSQRDQIVEEGDIPIDGVVMRARKITSTVTGRHVQLDGPEVELNFDRMTSGPKSMAQSTDKPRSSEHEKPQGLEKPVDSEALRSLFGDQPRPATTPTRPASSPSVPRARKSTVPSSKKRTVRRSPSLDQLQRRLAPLPLPPIPSSSRGRPSHDSVDNDAASSSLSEETHSPTKRRRRRPRLLQYTSLDDIPGSERHGYVEIQQTGVFFNASTGNSYMQGDARCRACIERDSFCHFGPPEKDKATYPRCGFCASTSNTCDMHLSKPHDYIAKIYYGTLLRAGAISKLPDGVADDYNPEGLGGSNTPPVVSPDMPVSSTTLMTPFLLPREESLSSNIPDQLPLSEQGEVDVGDTEVHDIMVSRLKQLEVQARAAVAEYEALRQSANHMGSKLGRPEKRPHEDLVGWIPFNKRQKQ